MLLKLSKVLAQNREFRPSWKGQPPDCLLRDNRFGMLMHVVSCSEQGDPKYDFPIWLERTGAVCVPVNQDGRIVLLRNYRPAVAEPSRLGEFPVEDPTKFGRLSLELPRGFPEPGETPEAAARREVEEETGFIASETVFLGATNANTTFFPFCNHVYLLRVDHRNPRNPHRQDNERIDEVILLTRQEVFQRIAGGEIFCGQTKSALMSYFAWRETEAMAQERAVPVSTD